MKHFVFFCSTGIIIAFLFLITGCKKNSPPECIGLPVMMPEPYFDPVWHPDGDLIGFNHRPVTGRYTIGRPPCEQYMTSVNEDSTGFYLVNKDGDGFRRVTNYFLHTPSWSPDGNWLAFSIPPHIYKMPFDGVNFDTSNVIRITDTGINFYPCWTPEGDSIFYDSDRATEGQGYYVWKMAADGTGHTGIEGTGRQPFAGSDNHVYYVRGANGQPEIFSMNRDGSDKKQLTSGNTNGVMEHPQYYDGKVYYGSAAILATPVDAFAPIHVGTGFAYSGRSFSISTGGQIVFVATDFAVSDKRTGTLWLADADGNNSLQLTFNNF